MILVTGDTHREFNRIEQLCNSGKLNKKDTIIILGDVGINYHGDSRDIALKKRLSKLPVNLFCIKGNHENYAGNIDNYELINYKGSKAYVEEKYPNLIFAKDGEIYDIEVGGNTKKVIVIGGAYSVDKYYRIQRDLKWFDDEQPSEETKDYVEMKLEGIGWEVDYVLSHTCPYRYIPREWFLKVIDQKTVDNSTEKWLDDIHEKLDYKKWYCGHFHGDKKIDRMVFMYRGIRELG